VDALLELDEVDGRAGGKASGLSRLAALGLPVPPAVVLSAAAYTRWRETGELPGEALARALERIGPPLAVRSSALDEDTEGRSAAGQYESVMGVQTLADLVAAVEACYRATESERARAYRGAIEAELALVIQREVPADRAAVAFSRDPLGDHDSILLEVVYGHGEQLVSGHVDPDRYWVARDLGTVRARVADKRSVPAALRFARTLRDDEAAAAARLVLEAEEGFGRPVDVELCFEGPRTWVVQCRPITTLA
jgi:phosphoenolpyruvate synthase/pyruvate phosphate dikinase